MSIRTKRLKESETVLSEISNQNITPKQSSKINDLVEKIDESASFSAITGKVSSNAVGVIKNQAPKIEIEKPKNTYRSDTRLTNKNNGS